MVRKNEKEELEIEKMRMKTYMEEMGMSVVEVDGEDNEELKRVAVGEEEMDLAIH